MPVIAALDGYALGGGAELAYAADIRIATPRLRIGNPETGLGIIAAAGASWRLKEIVGEARAIELLLTGRAIDADEARDIGLVTELHPADELLPAAHAIADRIAAQRPRRHDRDEAGVPRAARRPPRGRPRGAGRALREPREVPTHDRVPREEAQVTETPTGAPSDVGVLGGGRMGAGIAHAFLLAGSRVTVVERDADAAAAAASRVLESVAASVARGTADDDEAAIGARFATSTDVGDFAGCGLVVEAVPEDLELKIDALTRVEAVLPPDAALASNTSSISIDQLAALLDRPDRFLGMHFFNPVPASTLVEIVRGDASDGALVAEAREWVHAIGKTPIVVADAPGFASSRLGVALGLEAIRMLEDGVASARGHRRGHDARLQASGRPAAPDRPRRARRAPRHRRVPARTTLGERFAPPALLRRMVAEGKLGRKTGEGFYLWDAP